MNSCPFSRFTSKGTASFATIVEGGLNSRFDRREIAAHATLYAG